MRKGRRGALRRGRRCHSKMVTTSSQSLVMPVTKEKKKSKRRSRRKTPTPTQTHTHRHTQTGGCDRVADVVATHTLETSMMGAQQAPTLQHTHRRGDQMLLLARHTWRRAPGKAMETWGGEDLTMEEGREGGGSLRKLRNGTRQNKQNCAVQKKNGAAARVPPPCTDGACTVREERRMIHPPTGIAHARAFTLVRGLSSMAHLGLCGQWL